MYRSIIYQGAGVLASDAAEVAASKIRAFWAAHNDVLRCDTANFSPPNGHLLKFAVVRRSEAFLRDAVQVWKVDLNIIDRVDGKTVLDYIAAERARTTAPTVIRILDRYYRMFRDAGAKHRTEL
jgi:hypothetical protein